MQYRGACSELRWLHAVRASRGIVAKELARCDMVEEGALLATVARKGLCTMDPFLGHWMAQVWGEDCNTVANAQPLKNIVQRILPERKEHLEEHRTPGADAHLYRAVA